jgi:hypothetical protein
MTDTKARIRKSVISGRELFVCENVVEPLMVQQIGTLVRTLHYVRAEKSRADVPGGVAVCDIAPETIATDTFLRVLRHTVEKLFPEEQFTDQRAYVNCSVYGDAYYMHRDCAVHERHVTALYYANLEWQPDWGGETIYYNDEEDAAFAISPRPGRLVIARGAILHRGNVPTRSCYAERYSLAYKLNSVSPSSP